MIGRHWMAALFDLTPPKGPAIAETFGEPRLDECEGYRAYYFTMPGRPCISVMYVQVRRQWKVAA